MVKKGFLYISFLVVFIAFAKDANGQEMPLYDQYMMNNFLINPATAGYDGYTSINLLHHQQWIGMKDAPYTTVLSIHGRVLHRDFSINNRTGLFNSSGKRSGRVGLGGYVFNDVNGLTRRTGINLVYAYHIYMNNRQLSLGLGAMVYQFKLNADQLQFKDEEPLEGMNLEKPFYIPDINVGINYMTYNYYIGFSVNQLLQVFYDISYKDYSVKSDSVKVNRWPHFYFTGGLTKKIDNSRFEIEPSFLLKTSESLNPQLDVNLKVYYDKLYWFGLSYRTSSSIVALFGMKVKRLYIGYAYDYSFNAIRHFSYGSHELSVSYKLGDSARRYRWIQRY